MKTLTIEICDDAEKALRKIADQQACLDLNASPEIVAAVIVETGVQRFSNVQVNPNNDGLSFANSIVKKENSR